MSGSLPTSVNARKRASPSSLRENLQRKLEKIVSYGDMKPQTRAEFRVKRSKVPYYESASGHGSYDGTSALFLYGNRDVDPSWAKPWKRVQLPQVPTRKSGIVGPELDWSVRSRNMPIIFIKQMKDYAIPRSPVYQKVFTILFGHREFVHPKYRPAIGCSPTFNWTDFQVETWTKLANYLGVQYSGLKEYSFPRGTLGLAKGGSYYSNHRTPWPVGGKKGQPLPVFRSQTKARSEFSRMTRSLKRMKEIGVKPIDFSELLKVRRIKTNAEIRREWSKSGKLIPFREYKDSIPLCLSLNTQKPFPVSQIVLDSLKRIASSTSKLIPGKPWIIPNKDKTSYSYTIRAPIVPRKEVIHSLRAYISHDGNVYLTRSATNGIVNLLVDKKISSSKIEKALKIANDAQQIIDSHLPQDPPEDTFPKFTLGNWDSD